MKYGMVMMLVLLVVGVLSAQESVTFQANMRVQILRGAFVPSEDTLYVAGTFNTWGTTDRMTDANSDSVFDVTVSIATGPIAFKFRYFDGSGAADVWESVPDRPDSIETGGKTISLWFNDDSVYNPQVPVTVNFSCNMELERLSGRFNPTTDTVSARGDFNGWGRTDMSPNPLNADIYEASVVVNKAEGEGIAYKYFYKTSTADNWESGGNRTYTFTAGDLSGGEVSVVSSFNNGTLQTVLNSPATIKFTLLTTGAVSSVNGLPFPAINTAHIAGSALPLQWPAGGWPDADSLRMIKLYDDGTNGDTAGGDGVFSADVTFPAYTSLNVEYKYSINFGDIVNNGGGNDNENGFGNNHLLPLTRFMTAATAVDTFGTMGTSTLTASASPTPVEFRANMRVAILKGKFVPSEDTLYVAGTFNSWGTTDKMTDGDNDSIYTAIVNPAGNAGDTIKFKFRFREGDPGADQWESVSDRPYAIPTSGDAIFSAWFDNDSVYAPQVDISFTFSCNMELERLSGRFDPATDTISVNGSFNGWTSKTDIMTPNPLNADLYEVTVVIRAAASENIQFKFWYTDNNWESLSNRVYTFTPEDVTNGTASFSASFNNGSITTVLNAPCTIKFTVNMTGAVSAINGLAFPVLNTVHIAGGALPLKWPGGGWPDGDIVNVTQLFDDGSNGDLTAGDLIYSRDMTFPAYTVLDIPYKYGANWGDAANNGGGNDNEAGVGSDHMLHLTRYMIGATAVDTFGRPQSTVLNDVVGVPDESKPIPVSYSLGQNYPNPFNPATMIRYALPAVSDVQIKVYDIFGREVTTLVNRQQPAGEYSINFNASNLASGIYFYRISAGKYTETKRMMLIK
jgi:hypothetical protein